MTTVPFTAMDAPDVPADPVLSVELQHRARVEDGPERARAVDDARLQPCVIAQDTDHAVAVMAGQAGVDEVVADAVRFRRRAAIGAQDCGDQPCQSLGIGAAGRGSRVFCSHVLAFRNVSRPDDTRSSRVLT